MANSLIFFAEKMWVAFALQKLLTFLQQEKKHTKKPTVFKNTLAITVYEFVINKLVKLTMLWTTGPRKMLTKLRGCEGHSVSSLFVYGKKTVLLESVSHSPTYSFFNPL